MWTWLRRSLFSRNFEGTAQPAWKNSDDWCGPCVNRWEDRKVKGTRAALRPEPALQLQTLQSLQHGNAPRWPCDRTSDAPFGSIWQTKPCSGWSQLSKSTCKKGYWPSAMTTEATEVMLWSVVYKWPMAIIWGHKTLYIYDIYIYILLYTIYHSLGFRP